MVGVTRKKGGRVDIICGPMFSGKTEEGKRLIRLEKIAGNDSIIFKPSIDDRYSASSILTHYEKEENSGGVPGISVYSTLDMKNYLKKMKKLPGVLMFDEVSLIDEGIVQFCDEYRDAFDRMIFTLLDKDYCKEPFQFPNSSRNVGELMARGIVTHKSALCTYKKDGWEKICEREAFYTQKLIDGEPAPYLPHEKRVEVGSTDKYQARCGVHHTVPGAPLRNGGLSALVEAK